MYIYKGNKLSVTAHCILGLFLRLVLVMYAQFHDKYFRVPYTDVDYKVFSDAARYVTEGKSPFERHTFRYSPLLAFILIPNIFVHIDFGKIVFLLVDIVVAILIQRVLKKRGCERFERNICMYIWLYNPLTMVISTRGNADSLAVLLVITTLYYFEKDNLILAGLVHGLSVHFRLYPIVFSLPMFLSLNTGRYILPNKDQFKLVCSCIASISILTAVFYYLYGYKFLYESFLYHLLRKDVRHNFSVYFYMLYLSADYPVDLLQRILTFLPQLILLVTLSYTYSDKRQLPFAMFSQAMVMVMFNPVMTSQYFFWFLSLLPLCLPDFKISTRRALLLIVAWICSQSIWLFTAYLLEFQGINSFILIWMSGLLFFLVNAKILMDIIFHYKADFISNPCKT